MTKVGTLLILLLAVLPTKPTPAQTDEGSAPVAMIIRNWDDESGRDRAIEYINQGAVLELGADETAIIGYLQSCTLETVKGGVVTIGLEQSEIRGGTITREQFACAADELDNTLNPAPAEAWQWWLWPGSEKPVEGRWICDRARGSILRVRAATPSASRAFAPISR